MLLIEVLVLNDNQDINDVTAEGIRTHHYPRSLILIVVCWEYYDNKSGIDVIMSQIKKKIPTPSKFWRFKRNL